MEVCTCSFGFPKEELSPHTKVDSRYSEAERSSARAV